MLFNVLFNIEMEDLCNSEDEEDESTEEQSEEELLEEECAEHNSSQPIHICYISKTPTILPGEEVTIFVIFKILFVLLLDMFVFHITIWILTGLFQKLLVELRNGQFSCNSRIKLIGCMT